MAALTARERASLPDRAFAYIDPSGGRRLPIHDESHVRNALARFERVRFENDAAREKARRRLLNAAKRFNIVPVGFIDKQLRSERSNRTRDLSMYPTGSVTFLMTDIVDSTGLVARLGNRYVTVLRDVRGVVREAVRRCGGLPVDSSGDGYLAVFERAGPAMEAAIDLQRTMRERVWPKRLDVRVRVGLHGGRPTLTEDGYVGISVHTVARLCFVGHGGQIVVSTQTRTALGRSLPQGVRLRSLGKHRLPGIPKPVGLYQAHADGLASTFPPLRIGA